MIRAARLNAWPFSFFRAEQCRLMPEKADTRIYKRESRFRIPHSIERAGRECYDYCDS